MICVVSDYGYGRVRVANRTSLLYEWVNNEHREVHDHVWLYKWYVLSHKWHEVYDNDRHTGEVSYWRFFDLFLKFSMVLLCLMNMVLYQIILCTLPQPYSVFRRRDKFQDFYCTCWSSLRNLWVDILNKRLPFLFDTSVTSVMTPTSLPERHIRHFRFDTYVISGKTHT